MKHLDEKFWLKYFKVYDTLNNLKPYNDTLCRIVDNIEGNNLVVLDIGCGTGNLSNLILKKCKVDKITCIDFSKEALCIAKEKLALYKEKIVFIERDLNNGLKLGESKFDVIVMNNVLYAIDKEKRQELINDVAFLLNPGGEFIVSSVHKGFKPSFIYLNHMIYSFKNSFFKTIYDFFRFIYPTLLIFYYNYLIKKENNTGRFNFVNVDEQKDLLKNANFINISENEYVYANQAILNYGFKK